jgi:hypothetical protein
MLPFCPTRNVSDSLSSMPSSHSLSIKLSFNMWREECRQILHKLDDGEFSDEAVTTEGNVDSTLHPLIYPATPYRLFMSMTRLSLGSASGEAVSSPFIEQRSHSTLSQRVEGQRASSDTGTVQTSQSAVSPSVESCISERAPLQHGDPGCCENLPVDQFPIEDESEIVQQRKQSQLSSLGFKSSNRIR